MVTHPSTNRVWRSATTLIEANALPLSQTAILLRSTTSCVVSYCRPHCSICCPPGNFWFHVIWNFMCSPIYLLVWVVQRCTAYIIYNPASLTDNWLLASQIANHHCNHSAANCSGPRADLLWRAHLIVMMRSWCDLFVHLVYYMAIPELISNTRAKRVWSFNPTIVAKPLVWKLKV